MPQMNKGGKYILGKSLIREDLTLHLPPQAVTEYNIVAEGKVYLFTGRKKHRWFLRHKKRIAGAFSIRTYSY